MLKNEGSWGFSGTGGLSAVNEGMDVDKMSYFNELLNNNRGNLPA